MTEQEYIDLRDFIKVKDMQEKLSGIIAENSSIIGSEDVSIIRRILFKWHEGLYDEIKIDRQ